MPLSHGKLATWYVQLAQQLEAGVPLPIALRASLGTGAPGAGIEAMVSQLDRGASIDTALRTSEWLPMPDRLALSASAAAGRMPRTLRNLGQRHAQLGAAKWRVALACLYPLAILHLGLLLLPLVRMIDWEKGFQWDEAAYLRGIACTLLPLWMIAIVVWILARRQSPAVDRLARMLPLVGGYVRTQALADFSFALGNFLEAGVPIGPAWGVAGLTTRSRELQAAARKIEEHVDRGEPPGPRLADCGCFPPDFVAIYRNGETTGQLEAGLGRLATQYQESANRALTMATFLYPALTFLVVAGTVAYFVITIYAGYLRMLKGLAG
jgi:type II secretory pathway component PulF